MSDESRLSILFRKYVNGTADEQERMEFMKFVDLPASHEELTDLVDEEMRSQPIAEQLTAQEQSTILENIYSTGKIDILPAVKTAKLSTPIRLAIAAAVAFLAIGIYFFSSRESLLSLAGGKDTGLAYQNDIAPGKNAATLTLANGKTIVLSTAKNGLVISANELKYSDDTALPHSAGAASLVTEKGGQQMMLKAETPLGGTYQFVLPDGTRVWLNAGSSLSFPAAFTGIERIVELTGEGYFEVAASYAVTSSSKTGKTKKPFKVMSGAQVVTVLGTDFNIEGYNEQQRIKTTLLEGSVQVDYASGHAQTSSKAIMLKPGQQSELLGKRQIHVADVDTEEATAWKNGYFSFNDQKIQDIMQIIARWYNIEVKYEGNITKDGFNGKISRNKNISQVLKMLEETKLVHFKIEGRRVTVRE